MTEAENFWRRVAERAPDPVVILDPSRRFEFVSDSFLGATGLRRGELLGRPAAEVAVDADGSGIDQRLDRCEVGSATEFGVTLATVDGSTVHTRASLRGETLGGEPRYVLTMHVMRAGDDVAVALRRRVELEKLLERVQHRFIHAVPSEIGRVIVWALQEVAEYLGADRGYVLEFDHDARTETMIHEWARPGIDPELGEYTDVSWDLAPAATQRNNDLWISAVPDVSKLDGEWEMDRCFFEASGLKSILELPIIIDGHPVGGLGFDWLEHLADWTEDDLTLLGMFASTFAQLLGRDAAERELVRRANHDELTGLPNRAGVLGKLRTSLDLLSRSRGGMVGVLVIDIDQFKVVNDSLGNNAGDELLRLVGARLRGLVRPTDVVARLGADEFAVVLSGCADEWAVSQMSERLREGLAQPYEFRSRTYLLTVSSGIATTTSGLLSADELLRRAGAAVYRAKEEGRARQSVFDVELERRIAARLELDQQLRGAVERGEFEVHFQPEVELSTGRIIGAEALLRWRKDGVLRDAGSFIDVVEETGLIVAVGRWVLEEACRTAARWSGLAGREIVMRVNLSARQLGHPCLVEEVRTLLAEHGLDPSRLCLEITETAVMSNAEAALELLTELDALGISLAIDDFGTGYSSLSYLKRLPVDILKIDRSFVDGLPNDGDDLAIVTTIVHLAESLGMTVTAEGIETIDQARALVGLGCDRGQGWLYSKAVPADEIERQLRGLPVT
jgi:diguanylate cyclase (GGDEF)-like protein/PAS domain S-box-containing protein